MSYLLLTSFIWAFSFGLIKSQLSDLDPFLVAFLRLLLSLLIFLPFLRRQPGKAETRLVAIGAVQFGLMYCLYIYSYQYLQAHQVAVLTVTTPIFVVLIDAVRARRWIARYWAAALLAAMAALALVFEKDTGGFSLTGLFLVQGANFCFALGQLWYKASPRPGAARNHFAWLYLGGLLVPLLFLGWEPSRIEAPVQTGQWLSLLYLGLLPSGLGFFLWNKGVTLVNNGTVAAMNNLKAPLAALLAWAVFGETLDLPRLALSGLLFLFAFAFLKGRSRL